MYLTESCGILPASTSWGHSAGQVRFWHFWQCWCDAGITVFTRAPYCTGSWRHPYDSKYTLNMLLELYVKHNYSVLRGTLPLEFVAMNVIKTVHTLIKLFVFVVLSVIYVTWFFHLTKFTLWHVTLLMLIVFMWCSKTDYVSLGHLFWTQATHNNLGSTIYL